VIGLKEFNLLFIMAKKKFYITTAIDYVNAVPHIGHALEKIQADVIARYHRLLGEDVFFLGGTDEHGRKVAKAAEKANTQPQVFCDKISGQFRELAKVLNISNDDFICTTDQKKHWPTVKKAWLSLEKSGDIYKKKYKGLYCVGCEAFITKKDLVGGNCAIHQKEPEVVEEENYFFRLSKHSKDIQKALEKETIKIVPGTRKNEMLSFIKKGLEDISFSRPRKDLKWGIPVPSDNTQTIYVWADALVNYISALNYAENGPKFKKYWPADVHCIGKDIQKFHCLFWPGILLSLKLPLPKTIFVHGFISVDGQKMSKSIGNVIDPFELVKKYGTDPVRYFLLREIPSVEDGDFSYEKFEERYNSDLAKGLGNLVARVIKLAFTTSAKPGLVDKKLDLAIKKARKNYQLSLAKFRFNDALLAVWELISFCDKYIEKEKPWEEGKNQKEVIGNLLFALDEIAKLIEPFLPETSEKILEQLKSKKGKSLFPRI